MQTLIRMLDATPNLSNSVCAPSSFVGFGFDLYSGADPGFIERGFRCVKEGGGRFANFISFLKNKISHKNEIIWSLS